jgi:hypothetical protein
VQRSVPGLVAGEVAAAERMDVEAGRDEKLDSIWGTLCRRPSYEPRTLSSYLGAAALLDPGAGRRVRDDR